MDIIYFLCWGMVAVLFLAVVYLLSQNVILDFLSNFFNFLGRRQSTIIRIKKIRRNSNGFLFGEASFLTPAHFGDFWFILLENGEKIFVSADKLKKEIRVGDVINYKLLPTRRPKKYFRRARQVWPVKRISTVAVAVIIRDGKVLVARRAADKSFAGRWEFPGGKIEKGETPEQAAVREMMEELNCRIIPKKLLLNVISRSPEKIYSIFAIMADSPEQEIRPGFAHSDIAWAGKKEIKKLEFIEHDRQIIDFLIDYELLQ